MLLIHNHNVTQRSGSLIDHANNQNNKDDETKNEEEANTAVQDIRTASQ